MRIAVVQTDPVFGDVESNRAEALAGMKSRRADLYVLPELFNTGYNFIDGQELNRLAEPSEGETYRSIAAFAREYSCYVAYGFAEKADAIYNAAALVGPEGMIGLYRKVHLYFREHLFFAPGNLGFPVFDLPFGRVGMMICFDWIYPESARTLAQKGALMILHPSNLVLPHCPDAMVTRCLENRVFTATANRIGQENRGGVRLAFIGQSEVVSPRGEVLLRLGTESAGIDVIEIDPRNAENKQLNEFNELFGGLRPDQYEL